MADPPAAHLSLSASDYLTAVALSLAILYLLLNLYLVLAGQAAGLPALPHPLLAGLAEARS